jgi:uncharacterized protein YjbI with pentapeptide repeats
MSSGTVPPTGNPPAPPANPPGPPNPPTPPAPTAPDPDAALKTEKLELEIQELQRKMSRQYWGLELFKAWAPSITAAATAIVAIVALFWTINAGRKQIAQTQNAQDQDRFDKALTRLGSASVSERLTGAAGLSLFLTPDQESRHGATLRFLATALVIEKDPNVREAILDTFSHMDPSMVGAPAREDGLRTLLGLNRSTYKALLQVPRSEPETQKIVEAEEANLAAAVRASARAIVIFVKKGASQRDFSGINCEACDFSGSYPALDLSNADFDSAFLRNANFSAVELSGSSFAGAYLSGAKFEGADLKRARFTGIQYAVEQYKYTGEKPVSPDFACADASEANFSGSLFFGVIESTMANEKIAGYPDLFQTNLKGANLSKIGFYALPLARSKSAPPFKNAQINSYKPPSFGNHEYQAMHVVESPEWRFVATSPAFERSWDYLRGQLRLASGLEPANLPGAITLSGAVPHPVDASRCDQYRRSHGQ